MLLLYALSALSGALLGIAFPPVPLWFCAFVGFIPLFFVLEDSRSEGRAGRLLYTCFFVMHGASNWWVSSWQSESDPFLFVSGFALWLGHPFFFMIPVLAYRFLRKHIGIWKALALFPLCWTSFEWLHSLGDLSYPWLTLGYTQAYNIAWVQMADLFGVWGVSFGICAVNALIAAVALVWRESERKDWRILVSPQVIALLGVVILPYFYGMMRLGEYSVPQLQRRSKWLTAAVVQPNINPWKKWQGDVYEQISLHQTIQDSLRSLGHFDLAVWSETGIPYLGAAQSNPEGLEFLQPWLESSQTALLTGFTEMALYPSASAPDIAKPIPGDPTTSFNSFNSAIVLSPRPWSLLPPQVHRKMHLTPFGENIPIPFLEKWIQWNVGISSWTKGQVQKPLKLPLPKGDTANIGAIICIESVYPNFTRRYAAMGANILCVITNDAWYNYTSGPEQHYEIAALRAIETRRAVIRCGNSGISGFISPCGYSYSRLEPYQEAALAQSVPMIEDETLYTSIGDVLPKLSTAVIAISIGLIVLQNRRPKSRKKEKKEIV